MAMTTETVWAALDALLDYAKNCGLLHPLDETFARNTLLSELRLESYEKQEQRFDFPECLNLLCDYAAQQGMITDTIAERDLFDTKLMGFLTPRPSEVVREFRSRYTQSPKAATDYFYNLSQDCNYIRRDRIAKDQKWVYEGKYGALDITINLSKPEKDPRAIAAAKLAPQSGYPKCQLCPENEGYAGRMNHPARQNHRIIPLSLSGESWYFQYSPYVYYNEHCICLNAAHVPMTICRACFEKLLDVVTLLPHYFVGSNADLPIVGGSILSHEHFQGGHYVFAMERAKIGTPLTFRGFEDVEAGIVNWPMSVIRLRAADRKRLAALAEKILTCWRGYSDAEAFIFAETDGEPHNTITPIARRRGDDFEMDLVLRNNITTPEHPLGVYHPHAKLHHIKKENIGLIEVMGLAVLPSRLKGELAALREAILSGSDIRADETLAKHADWVDELKTRHTFTAENTEQILHQEVGAVFEQVLEDAGVYKTDKAGREAFLRFVQAVNQ